MSRWIALTAYLALVFLVLAWEAWWAPTTPLSRVFWVALKTIPLMIPLPWLLRGSAYAHALASILVLAYFCDGVALAYSAAKSGNAGDSAYAAAEILFAVLFIAAAAVYARLIFRTRTFPSGAGTES